MEETEIKISEFEKQCWQTEAKRKNALKILIFEDITDQTLFPHYLLEGEEVEKIKKDQKLFSNSFIGEIPLAE